MITPMMKYALVLYHKEYTDFLERLQELGLMDITIHSWEPTESQRPLMSSIERFRKAEERLRLLEQNAKPGSDAAPTPHHGAKQHAIKRFASPEEAFLAYDEASAQLDRLAVQLAAVTKELNELRPWGDFEPETLSLLAAGGLGLHFYRVSLKDCDELFALWSADYSVTLINRDNLHAYLAVAVPTTESLTIDAQEVTLPMGNLSSKSAELAHIEQQIAHQEAVIAACIPYRKAFKAEQERLLDQLHLDRVSQSGQREAEGALIILEGWATSADQARVDSLLDETGTPYLKERPTPEDDAPVLLKNNWFGRLSETIGGFYALPKYGTMDLTPFFGPFYILFFGFCLGDAGYGLIYVLIGLYMALKLGEKMEGQMKRYGWLVFFCGIATMLFGILTGGFFGVELAKLDSLARFKDYFLTTEKLFTLSIALGFVHLLFGMSLKVVNITRQFGIRYALSTLGWLIVIVASLAAYLLPGMGVSGFDMHAPLYFCLAGIGLFMMLFLNSPGKNPFINLGAGIWNTYNDTTGLLGDILSYIRLFALGLAGGVLGQVFNSLAVGLSPDIPILKPLVIVLILLFGHGINLFMSSLSSFVHPMRLTFVEFYKNAGFEAGQRLFTPLKKSPSVSITPTQGSETA